MSDSIGKVRLDLETNYSQFDQQLNQISGKATGKVSSAFSKLGKVAAAAFAVTKLVQFGKEAVNLASDLQEVQNVVDVVFGESAGQINNFAKTAITQYGLSELSAKQYASTMGAMLKSMGLSEQATLGMSQAITGLTGDMASFYNLDSGEAFAKIRAGISGETEPLKQLGINMSVANMEAYAMSQGITKSYQSMTQSEQALLRYNYLLSTTSDAQGDFARTSNSWANQTRILREQFNSLKATLGSSFIAVLTPVVKMLNWVISKLQIAAAYFKAFIEALTGVKAETGSASSGLGDIADNAIEAGDATVEAAKKASGALAGFDKLNVLSSSGGDSDSGGSGGSGGSVPSVDLPSMSDLSLTVPEPDMSGVTTAVNKVTEGVKQSFNGLKTYITTAFAPTIQSWGSAFQSLKEPAMAAFGSIVTSTQKLHEETLAPFDTYLKEEFVPSLTNNFSENFAPIFTEVTAFAFEEFAKDYEFACQQIDNLTNDILKPTMETVKQITTDTNDAIGNEWEKSGTDLLELFGGFRDSIKEIWNNLYTDILKPVWDIIIEAVDGLWENHLKGLWESFLGFCSSLGQNIMALWNTVLSPIVNWIIDKVAPVIVGIIQTIIANLSTIIGAVIDATSSIFQGLGGLLDFITGIFTGDWEKAWSGIGTFIISIFNGIWGAIKSIINFIIDGLNALWTGLYSALAGIVNGVGGLVKNLGKAIGQEWGWEIPSRAPQIPKLARGGIIDQPTLAMVGEAGKEAVVPLENTAFADSIANAILRVLAPLLANGGITSKNTDGNTVIILKVGEYELGRVTVGAINKYHNVIGKVELEV